MPDEPAPLRTLSRRVFLLASVPAAACAGREAEPAGPRPVSVPLERVPPGARVTLSVAGRPVELVRTAGGVTARSLLCTHQGCEVSWDEAAGDYACPCHEGRFDAEGRPKTGPPPKPLATLPTRVEGGIVLVGP